MESLFLLLIPVPITIMIIPFILEVLLFIKEGTKAMAFTEESRQPPFRATILLLLVLTVTALVLVTGIRAMVMMGRGPAAAAGGNS